MTRLRNLHPGWLLVAPFLGLVLVSFWISVLVRTFSWLMPLTMPGLVAANLLVFILCLGFYVAPAVLGGGKA